MQGDCVAALNSSRVHSMMRKSLSSTCCAISVRCIRRRGRWLRCFCLLRLAVKQLEVVHYNLAREALSAVTLIIGAIALLALDVEFRALVDVRSHQLVDKAITKDDDVMPSGAFRDLNTL